MNNISMLNFKNRLVVNRALFSVINFTLLAITFVILSLIINNFIVSFIFSFIFFGLTRFHFFNRFTTCSNHLKEKYNKYENLIIGSVSIVSALGLIIGLTILNINLVITCFCILYSL